MGRYNGNVNPESPGYLPQVRQALANENYKQAETLVKHMQGLYTQSYMPLGDLRIRQAFDGATPTGYYRDLDIQKAVATTRFTVNGTDYKREVFTSAPDQLMVIRLTASKPGQLSIDLSTRSQLRFTNTALGTTEWTMNGKAPRAGRSQLLQPQRPRTRRLRRYGRLQGNALSGTHKSHQ